MNKLARNDIASATASTPGVEVLGFEKKNISKNNKSAE